MKKLKQKIKRKIKKLFKGHMSHIIVTLSIATVITFTVVDIYLEIKDIHLSDTLIEWVYKFFGLELLALSGIKVSKHIGSAFGRMDEAVDGSEPLEESEE